MSTSPLDVTSKELLFLTFIFLLFFFLSFAFNNEQTEIKTLCCVPFHNVRLFCYENYNLGFELYPETYFNGI